MKLRQKFVFGLSVLALSMGAMAAGAHAPKPDPQQGDGRVSAFYTWQEVIPATPGKLLRSEPLEKNLSLPNAASAQRILYSSTDGIDNKTPIVVSGTLFLPKGKAPAGGWPVASWGHGTVGVADVCAPSWQGRSYRDVQYLSRWLDEGYAIVATDYQGLGVPGGHPLLNNRMAAYGILDAAKAVVAGVPGLANKVLIVGQSQGGAGAFASAAYAPTYAPDLGVKGSIGTGVIYTVGAKNVGEQDVNKVDASLAYGFYTLLAAQQYDPSINPQDFYTDSYALFGNLTYDFTDNFSVTSGLRWTQEKKDIDLDLTQLTRTTANGPLVPLGGVGTNGSREENKTWEAWTYDLTPEYRINDNVRVFFRYAHGFRSGGFNTGLSTSLAQLTTVDPEQLDAYEIGLKSEWFDHRLTANANIFYYDYSDIQVNLLTVNNGVLTTALTNGAKGTVKGAELELEGQPTDYLHLRAAVSFLDTEYTDFKNTNPNTGAVTGDYSGNSFVRSPRNVVALGADYTIPLEIGGKLVAGGDVSFRDKEYFLADRQSSADKTLSQDHYTLANTRLTWFSQDEKLSVTGFVNNVTDRRYQVHGRPNGTLGQYVITYGDPRTVGLSVTSRF